MTEVEKQVNVSEESSKGVEVEGTTNNGGSESETPATEQEKNNSTEESKTVEDDEEISQLESDIIRQIEYYFGDANLQRDKFLLDTISKDSEGWVPFDVLLKFKRLATLTKDIDVIVNALTKSDEGLIEISDDKTKIRRHPERPIPESNEEARKEIVSRSAYVKGFPLDSEISVLIDYFKPYEKVLNIHMRRYLDKPTKSYKFKGSVFVTFAKKEQCEEFINKEKVQYKGKDLIRKWQEDYLEEKRKEREEYTAKKKAKQQKKQEPKIDLPKGAVLHFEGCDENTTREAIKDAISPFEVEIAYVEYNKGEKSGHVRFTSENAASTVLDKLEDKKLKVDEAELTLRLLTGEEEEKFLANVVNQMKSKRNVHNRNRNRKRKTSEKSDNEPPSKKVDRVEAME